MGDDCAKSRKAKFFSAGSESFSGKMENVRNTLLDMRMAMRLVGYLPSHIQRALME